MRDVRVDDVMTHLVVMLYPNETLPEAARKLARNGISGAPVVERGKVVGLVSEADLVRAVLSGLPPGQRSPVLDVLHRRPAPVAANGDGRQVRDVMSASVVDVGPAATVWEAAAIMESRGVKRLPVIDEDGYLIGVIARSDVVRAIARATEDVGPGVAAAVEALGA